MINSFILFVLSILIINGQGFVLNNILTPKQKQRVETLINPSSDPLGSGWNITQSKIAIGSGGVFGKGFLKELKQVSILFLFKVLILFFL